MRHKIILSLCAAVGIGFLALNQASDGSKSFKPEAQKQPSPAAEKKAPATQAEAQNSAGMKAYINPKTGNLSEKPIGRLPMPSSPTARAAMKFTEVPLPGGGTMVDLQGEFMEAQMATLDSSGKVVVQCQSIGTAQIAEFKPVQK